MVLLVVKDSGKGIVVEEWGSGVEELFDVRTYFKIMKCFSLILAPWHYSFMYIVKNICR